MMHLHWIQTGFGSRLDWYLGVPDAMRVVPDRICHLLCGAAPVDPDWICRLLYDALALDPDYW